MSVVSTVWGWFQGAYEGANRASRHRTNQGGLRSFSGDEESALRPCDRESLRLEARDLFRNNETASATVNRISGYTVGPFGITPRVQTSSKKWNKNAAWYWKKQICPYLDHRGRTAMSMAQIQKIIINSLFTDGECGHILRADGMIQSVEGEMIATPQKYENVKGVRDGIRYGAEGKIVSYFICARDENGKVDKNSFQEVAADNFIYIPYPYFRFSQARGVTGLASAIEKLRDLDETDRAHLGRVKLEGRQHLKLTMNDAGSGAPALPSRRTVTTDANGVKRVVEHTEQGVNWMLGKGEDVQSFELRSPNPGFIEYMHYQLKLVAAATGLPVEYILMSFTDGSYSAQRAVMTNADQCFKGWQQYLIEMFLNRIWAWRIGMAVAKGDLAPAPMEDGVSQWNYVEWNCPALPWVDPDAEITAATKAWNGGVKSLKTIVASTGADRDDVLDEKLDDIFAAQERATKFNKKFPKATPLRWQDIIQMSTQTFDNSAKPEAPTTAVDTDANTESEEAEEPEENDDAEERNGVKEAANASV